MPQKHITEQEFDKELKMIVGQSSGRPDGLINLMDRAEGAGLDIDRCFQKIAKAFLSLRPSSFQ